MCFNVGNSSTPFDRSTLKIPPLGVPVLTLWLTGFIGSRIGILETARGVWEGCKRRNRIGKRR